MPIKSKEEHNEYARNWARTHPEIQRRYVKGLRVKVLKVLGGKCVYCECDDFEALEINHINGGGAIEAREYRNKGGNKAFYLDILAGRRKKEDLELTCKICNAWYWLVKQKGLNNRWTIKWE